jgi:WD40 repeat protein/serine/threonine protein kinase/tetratricopeptide (TPR) repeat protein
MALDPRHVKALFSAALDLPDPAERPAFLERECQGDQELRARLEELLAAFDQPASALERPLAGDPGETSPAEPPPAATGAEPVALPGQTTGFRLATPPPDTFIGTIIAGRYKLRQEIGEGGMGSVYLAEQTQPVKRHVALKLIKPGMDSRTVLARFETERQALALMDHPNIARVLDAGATDQGRPFFVMELVKGVPLTDYCDQHRLGLPERLTLFRQICSAVQHAHQKGIIHRDLKPTNILVESHDGHPVPKVIDFGLAKATSGLQLSEHSLFTAFGTVAGTPLYMAPEQAAFNALDVDTRADIYALGVILYELLTGTTPIQRETFKQAALDEILRVIREVEPPTPSSRISTSAALPAIAATRQIEPSRLGRFVRGDLDWIVMKALAKERQRRYESAIALAQDLERFVNHEPVSAGPPTASYRLRKFLRRNRPQVVAAVLVLLALAALAAGLARQQKLKAEKAQTERLLKAESVAHREAETARAAEQVQRKKAETYLYYNKIVLAEREWTAGNVARVKELLQQCPPEARGWEWRYLDQLCRHELASVQGPDDFLRGAALSPDGKWVVSGGGSLTVRCWDSSTGKVMHELSEKFQPIWLEVSPDARLVVSVAWHPFSSTNTATLWDAATGKPIQELLRYQGGGRPGIATFSPDGQWLALAIEEPGKLAAMTLWDPRARPLKPVRTLKVVTRTPMHMAFSPDSRRLAYAGLSPRSAQSNTPVGELKIWQTDTAEALLSVEDLPFAPNGTMAFSPDGRQLALAADDRAVHVLDTQTGKERAAFRGDSESLQLVAYRPDGKLLASEGIDGIVQLWDPVSRKNVRTLRGGASLMALAFGADGRRLMTCSQLNRVASWDPDTGQDPLTLQVKDLPHRVAVSPDGQRLACGTNGTAVTIWDPATGLRLQTLRGHTYKPWAVAFSPDGRLLATGAHDHTVILWDPVTGQPRRKLPQEGSIYALAFSPDGQLLAASLNVSSAEHGPVGRVVLLSMASGQPVRTLSGHTHVIWDVAFSPDGERLVSTSADQTARVWDVKTGRQRVCFRGHRQEVMQARFSPDGRSIATTSVDETVKVWDAETGDVLHTLRGHTSPTLGVAFSRDARRIATTSSDRTIKIWDAASGEELLTLRGHGDEVSSVVFGPEDQWLASSGNVEDRTIRLWEATPPTPERRLQREAAALVNNLPDDLGFKDEILAYLRTLPSLSEPVREHALTMAERLPEDPWRLNFASNKIVWQSGLDAARYRLKLRYAEAARDLAHPGFNFDRYGHPTTHIGIAHYRLGEYREAVEALTAAEAYYAARSPRNEAGTAMDLAFLAMAQHRLGEEEKAQTALARLHNTMRDPDRVSRDDLRALMREAEEWIVWGAPPPTEEERRLRREAADQVDKLPAALGFKDEILAYLRSLSTLSEPVREHALTMVERLPDDPFRLNRASYLIVMQPGRDVARYQRALRQAEAARDLAPPAFIHGPFYHPTTHIGIAHYRLGEYREAVEALTAAEAYYATPNIQLKAGAPWDLAFLAMAQHRLGEDEKARAFLARLREVMKDPAWTRPGPHQLFSREAEALIEGKSPDSQK